MWQCGNAAMCIAIFQTSNLSICIYEYHTDRPEDYRSEQKAKEFQNLKVQATAVGTRVRIRDAGKTCAVYTRDRLLLSIW
jgi:hypothetical protein